VKLLEYPLHPDSPIEQELVAISKESIGDEIARIDAEIQERTATESPESDLDPTSD
jgi:hypothetical protein